MSDEDMRRYYRGFTFDHEITDNGQSIVTCTREGAGICGIGRSDEEAMQDFVDKQDELLPLPKSSRVIFSSQFEPPEYGERERRREDE